MNFLIDYDTRSVECKCEDADVLQNYIKEYDLGLAVTVISEADDMVMEMSLAEIQAVFDNLSDRERKFEDEDEAAEITFAMLQSHSASFPTFTPALGKKLFKAGEKRSSDTAKGKATGKPKTASKTTTDPVNKPAKRAKTKKVADDTVFELGEKAPKQGTIHSIVTNCIEENLGEATFDELMAYFVENYTDKDGEQRDEKFAKGYIKGAIRKNFIQEKL